MSVIACIITSNNVISTSNVEVAAIAASVAKRKNQNAISIVIGNCEISNLKNLGKAGSKKIYHIKNPKNFDNAFIAHTVNDIAKKENASICIFPHDALGKASASRLAIAWNAPCTSGITTILNVNENTTRLKKNVFSGKATATIIINAERQVWTILPNSLPTEINEIEPEICEYTSTHTPKTETTNIISSPTNSIPLPTAEKVVAGGRGLGGPEHWHIIEQLANEINAATACSRPVADAGWRPHHEHVGQTGSTIRPNLYIAIAISGATQHLAGINGSKIIAVINKDPDAPFFASADFGIIGDAFVIVPKLIELIKKNKH